MMWKHRGVEEATWEHEDTMRATYPFLFRNEGTQFNCLVTKWLVYMREIMHIAYAFLLINSRMGGRFDSNDIFLS